MLPSFLFSYTISYFISLLGSSVLKYVYAFANFKLKYVVLKVFNCIRRHPLLLIFMTEYRIIFIDICVSCRDSLDLYRYYHEFYWSAKLWSLVGPRTSDFCYFKLLKWMCLHYYAKLIKNLVNNIGNGIIEAITSFVKIHAQWEN